MERPARSADQGPVTVSDQGGERAQRWGEGHTAPQALACDMDGYRRGMAWNRSSLLADSSRSCSGASWSGSSGPARAPTC